MSVPFLIAFSSNPEHLVGADRFCCIDRVMGTATFPRVTEDTGVVSLVSTRHKWHSLQILQI